MNGLMLAHTGLGDIERIMVVNHRCTSVEEVAEVVRKECNPSTTGVKVIDAPPLPYFAMHFNKEAPRRVNVSETMLYGNDVALIGNGFIYHGANEYGHNWSTFETRIDLNQLPVHEHINTIRRLFQNNPGEIKIVEHDMTNENYNRLSLHEVYRLVISDTEGNESGLQYIRCKAGYMVIDMTKNPRDIMFSEYKKLSEWTGIGT